MDKILYFGVPIEELTRDELLEALRLCAKENRDLRKERFDAEMRTVELMGDCIRLSKSIIRTEV